MRVRIVWAHITAGTSRPAETADKARITDAVPSASVMRAKWTGVLLIHEFLDVKDLLVF